MRLLMMWLSKSEDEWSWDLLTSLWRWNFMGMRLAMASIPSIGEVLNAPNIQMAALLYIFSKIFIGYERRALL